MVWIAIDGASAGMAALADEPRAGAAAAVAALQVRGDSVQPFSVPQPHTYGLCKHDSIHT